MPVGVVVKVVEFGCCALCRGLVVVAAGGGCPKHAFCHIVAVLGEHVPVCVQLHVVCWEAPGFEVEDEGFAGVSVGEDTVDVANDLGAVLEGGFYRVFDSWLAV